MENCAFHHRRRHFQSSSADSPKKKKFMFYISCDASVFISLLQLQFWIWNCRKNVVTVNDLNESLGGSRRRFLLSLKWKKWKNKLIYRLRQIHSSIYYISMRCRGISKIFFLLCSNKETNVFHSNMSSFLISVFKRTYRIYLLFYHVDALKPTFLTYRINLLLIFLIEIKHSILCAK